MYICLFRYCKTTNFSVLLILAILANSLNALNLIFANKNTQSREHKMSLIRWLSSARSATLPKEGEPSGMTAAANREVEKIRQI